MQGISLCAAGVRGNDLGNCVWGSYEMNSDAIQSNVQIVFSVSSVQRAYSRTVKSTGSVTTLINNYVIEYLETLNGSFSN